MAVCSWIAIPAPIPFTLQTLGLFITVSLLGGRRGSMAVLIYLLLGLVGVPVFASFTGGIGIFMGERGGYLIGLFIAALVMWGMERLSGRSARAAILSMALGLTVCYTFGTVWFAAVHARVGNAVSAWSVISLCVLPYIIPDALKVTLAWYIRKRFRPFF
ncbi:MAG: biotin transporter BioY [Clostridia bacterium]|nr:biotin transporter BioY [Clostridia bacterium]